MAAIIFRSILIVLLMFYVFGDEIEMEVQSGAILKMLREMVNQTSMDTLSLPANSTSIRENITDTFSCENRTYGYYADVDNDCQIFHVCVPTQMPSGRNVTLKYSFICPKETVFNQRVSVCVWNSTYMPCEDSPEYYPDKKRFNIDIGETADPKEVQNMRIEQLEGTTEEEDAAAATDFEMKQPKRPDEEVENDDSDVKSPVNEIETGTSKTATTEDFDIDFRLGK